MDFHGCVAFSLSWLHGDLVANKRLTQQQLLPFIPFGGKVRGGAKVQLKYRTLTGQLIIDDEATIVELGSDSFLRPSREQGSLQALCTASKYLVLWVSTGTDCIVVLDAVQATQPDLFHDLEATNPTLRLSVFGLPPSSPVEITAPTILEALRQSLVDRDPDLYSVHSTAFLGAPHIIVPLFAHVLSLSTTDHFTFTTQLSKIGDQLRTLLLDPAARTARIDSISLNHASFWPTVEGRRIAFLDGGAARITGIPTTEPLALRIGVYSVRPGIPVEEGREEWSLRSHVIGDIIAPVPDAEADPPDRKRLQEAARYVLEPFGALDFLRRHADTRMMFLHGPLVNQFTQYDEGEPNYIPCVAAGFLEAFGIDQSEVERVVEDVPLTASGRSLWNQFMAVYGYVTKTIHAFDVPIAGVVERTAGRWVADSVLSALVKDGVVLDTYRKKVLGILERFDISDDFLFGCILKEGEFVTPLPIHKNPGRKVRDRWRPVVEQYPAPLATVLKTSEANFPFRVELNRVGGNEDCRLVLETLYHTSRLLPNYAFPVGLDIVDKFAKVPDWLSRGVSARLSTDILRRALATGDANLVMQVRQLLAHTPRDFFYRPGI